MRCAEAKNSYFLCLMVSSHIHFCWIIASDKQLRFWLCIGENRRQSKHWWMKEWNARPNVNAKRFEYVIWHIDYELNTNKMRRPFALLCFIMHGMACSVMSVPKWPNDIPGSSRLFLFARRISSDRYIYIYWCCRCRKNHATENSHCRMINEYFMQQSTVIQWQCIKRLRAWLRLEYCGVNWSLCRQTARKSLELCTLNLSASNGGGSNPFRCVTTTTTAAHLDEMALHTTTQSNHHQLNARDINTANR